jgi:hypothetical protein
MTIAPAPGHVDGLKINPTTDDIWATENEDGNPTLALIDHKTGKFKIFTSRLPSSMAGSMTSSFPGVTQKTYSSSLHPRPILLRR